MARLGALVLDPESGVSVVSCDASPVGLDYPRGTVAVRRDGSGVWYKAGTGVNDWVQLAPGATPLESLLSVFGSGATDPADAEGRGGPMQWAGVFTDWRVATVDGGTGTVAFDVKKNGTSMIGAGAAPALSAAASASGSCSGWTTTSFAAGDRITVHVNGAPSGGPGETTVALGATRS